jgi:phosphoribosylamine--glycine ligase
MASGGFSGSYARGKSIVGLFGATSLQNLKLFHAGTARVGDQIVTSRERVLGVMPVETIRF